LKAKEEMEEARKKRELESIAREKREAQQKQVFPRPRAAIQNYHPAKLTLLAFRRESYGKSKKTK
jgi:hypothetical protein